MLSASFRITARRCAIIASTSSFTPTEISCGFRQPMQILVNVRHVSTAKEIFGLTQEILNISDLPPVPLPPPPLPSIEDLALSGQSVLNELGLLSWWKPSSYFRLALEGLHNHFDLPWWATIMCATVILRLSLIIVPIMSQRLIAKQSMYRKELAEFQERISDARREGNNLLMQQILLEQRDFMVSKDIKIGRQFLVTLANGAVFGTQFFAIREMVNANFPGWNTGGILWFTNLCAVDPYWALPLLSAITMGIVFRAGIEMGTSSAQMGPVMRVGMLYGAPVLIFCFSSRFASALCLYWCTSNIMSLIYAGVFRVPAVRKLFNIPKVIDRKEEESGTFSQLYKRYADYKEKVPTVEQLRKDDARRFKRAGRGKPVVGR